MEILFRQPSFQGISPAKITTKSSLLDLPTEIVSKIFKLVPNQLKATCKTCYLLYNEYYCEKLVDEMGNDIIYNIAMYNIPYLVDYIKSFDYWRYDLRNMIAKEYDLKDYEQDSNIRRQMTPKEIVECKYVKDSWKLVYAIFKNRRLFVEYQDYEIDEPQSYLSYSMLHINKTYLVKYKKSIKLSSDLYNLSCGIVIQNALGLGSMNFKVIRTDTKEELMSFFPPTNINDLVPHERFVMLDLGVFYVAPPKKTVLNNDTPSGFEIPSSMQTDKLVEVDIIMEETGLYLKSGFIICYVDVNAYPSTLKKLDPETNDKLVPVEEKRWIAWSIDNQVPHPENVVNVLLKRLYKSINTSLFLKPLPSPFQRIGTMSTSESLFDNNFATDSHTDGDALPTDVDIGKTLITYRILVSRREAGAIIGKNGDCITRIRDETTVKAGVSKVIDGCIDRILTITGIVDNVPESLVLFAKAITESNVQAIEGAAANGTDPTSLISYNFFPLKALCPPLSPSDPNYQDTLSLRLLIPNSQIGTLIGKGGVRIKAIQEDYNVKMVASKDHLKNSTERIVEVQGTAENLKEALGVISKCLLNDYHGVVTTVYYTPTPRESTYRGESFSRSGGPRQSNGGAPLSNKDVVTDSVSFPGEYVGALIGKKGSRIQEIRRMSGCTIGIDADNNDNGHRVFRLTGAPGSIKKALAALWDYYEREKARREESEDNE
ncbi:hypothetical protein CANARDRAFT_194285 [[Candida] arabinofermentans NRRL YB-2248]|uniref:K Homology domain-containing protein n=1 Tax=[Candida] arabinofermentans NRRL YB-2248 TaxID=983967 RepID=A0A1E4T5L6_9ASCO|nr:hypothetical protein CANARDRAFT_194285 [[Candida] arabinofermentans NRRL YB-2248]